MKQALLLTLILLGSAARASVLKEYLSYSLPIDLRHVVVMADYDVSAAIGSTLLRPSDDGLVASAMAEKWSIDPAGHWIDFYLGDKSKWSDGSRITAHDVIESFNDTKKNFGKDFPGVFEASTGIEEVSPFVVRFHLANGVSALTLLPKFTDTTYGLVKISAGKSLINVTSGPYSVKSVDEKNLVLAVNRYWYAYSPQMIDEIHLRRSNKGMRVRELINDPWPDMINLITGLTKDDRSRLPPGFKIMHFNHDRLLTFSYAGPDNLKAVRTVFGYLRSHADFSKLASLIDDGVVATQLFGKGCQLNSPRNPAPSHIEREEVARVWKGPAFRVAYYKDRIQPEVIAAAEEILNTLLPMPAKFYGITIKEMETAQLSGKYDVIFGSFGVDGDAGEEDVSAMIEWRQPVIPSDKTPKGNFMARLKHIRKTVTAPIPAFRELAVEAVENNYVLPVAHFSTVILGRPEIDFSHATKFGVNIPFYSLRRIN